MGRRFWLMVCLTGSCEAYAADAPLPPDSPSPATTDAATEFIDAYHTYQQLVADKKFEEALPFAQRALELGTQLYGPNHKNTAALTLNLGDAFLKTGHALQAVAPLDSAVYLYEQAYGPDAPELIDPLMARAEAAGSIDPKQQQAAIERALRIAHAHAGANDLTLARLNQQAGVLLLQGGSVPQAKGYLEDAYAAYAGQFPVTDARVGVAAFWLGKYWRTTADGAAAERYLTEALVAFEQPGAGANPLAIAAHTLLVGVYQQREDSAKVTEQCVAVGRLQSADHEPHVIPLYRVNPNYPNAAIAGRLEGWVQVELTIDASGVVRDPKVVDTGGSDSFRDAALTAISMWRYAPRFVDGAPVDTPGIKVVLTFKLSA